MFAMGNLHDQGWFKPSAEAESVDPLLCFSKRFLNTDTLVGELGEVEGAPGRSLSIDRSEPTWFRRHQKAQRSSGADDQSHDISSNCANAAFSVPKQRERPLSAFHVQERSEFNRSIRP